MRRIAGPGATGDNKFTQGNPGTGVPPTQVTSEWLNGAQESILAPVIAAGLTPSQADDTQLLQAIRLLNTPLPSGSLAPVAQTTPNMTVKVLPGFIYNGTTTTAVAGGNTAAIATAINNPRIDRLVYNATTGAISIITGTENASPTAPAVTAGNLPLAQIYVAKNATSITNANITDERASPFQAPQTLLAGTVLPWAGTTLPTGYLWCDGTAVSRTTYAALFAATSTAFGVGNGTTTFNVPDLRGRVVVGKDDMGGATAGRITVTYAAFSGTTLGAAGGDERMQTHNHAVNDMVSNFPGYRDGSGGGSYPYSYQAGSTSVGTTAAGLGGSQNVQPSQILNYIIKT